MYKTKIIAAGNQHSDDRTQGSDFFKNQSFKRKTKGCAVLPQLPEAKQNVLALMRRLRDMGDVDYLQSLIAYHAAPTVMGIKPATLVCPGASERNLAKALNECGPRLGEYFGVRVANFRNRAGALLLLVYNLDLLQSALSACEVTELLADAGYEVPTASVESLLDRLRQKCAGSRFPHEIGVFLGYPPCDVRRFMNDGDGRNCRSAGCWKAYGDIAEAKTRSARFGRAKMRAAELLVGGADLQQMARELRDAV